MNDTASKYIRVAGLGNQRERGMKVWMIRECINTEILDIVTSSSDMDSAQVTQKWRETYLGRVYATQYPNAGAILATHFE